MPTPSFMDQAVDPDSHEMIPMHMWPDLFGEAAHGMMRLVRTRAEASLENSAVRDDLLDDVTPIDGDVVWNMKGPEAPGAIDLRRRPQVLDAMGITRQMVFPTFALWGLAIATNPDAPNFWGFDPDIDFRSIGRAAVAAQNEWSVDIMRDVDADRVRPPALILTESVEQMMRDASDAITRGIRVLWIPIGAPPAGTSPADRALDPFWSLAEEAGVTVVSHLGTEFGLIDPRWHAGVPAFSPAPTSSVEFVVEPHRSANLNLAQENFLAAMVLGGVFERHPALRFGILECGAQWVGPLAEKLDLWAGQFSRRLADTVKRQPSEYLVRNVRATPFVFEPIDRYFERWPELVDIYCFSTDYPHREGGKESKRVFYERISHLGEAVQRKFFVENATWLLPPL